MKLDRAIDIQNELRVHVMDLYSRARSFHMTSEAINEAFNKLFDRYPKDLPRNVREYIRGFRDALNEQLYRDNLVHGYEWKGELYTTWDSFPPDLHKAIIEGGLDTASLVHGHYWKDTIHGERKPYFLGWANTIGSN